MKGAAYNHIRLLFEEIGYTVRSVVLDTAKHSVLPHHRERLYITCLRSAEAAERLNMIYPRVEPHSFRRFLEPKVVDEKYFYSARYQCFPKLQAKCVRQDRVYQMRFYSGGYVRELEILPTMTCGLATGGHQVPLLLDGGRIRKLTPRELYSLQGFPETFNLSGLSDTKLNFIIGNSVSIPIVRLVLQHALDAVQK